MGLPVVLYCISLQNKTLWLTSVPRWVTPLVVLANWLMVNMLSIGSNPGPSPQSSFPVGQPLGCTDVCSHSFPGAEPYTCPCGRQCQTSCWNQGTQHPLFSPQQPSWLWCHRRLPGWISTFSSKSWGDCYALPIGHLAVAERSKIIMSFYFSSVSGGFRGTYPNG